MPVIIQEKAQMWKQNKHLLQWNVSISKGRGKNQNHKLRVVYFYAYMPVLWSFAWLWCLKFLFKICLCFHTILHMPDYKNIITTTKVLQVFTLCLLKIVVNT
jgi:hypothetical protein